ncbi:MAG: protein translocase subunit SecD [Rhodospirillales bacterium]|nr:protein translocase subunit SecD [Rhodospirillales bacterium]
MINIPTWKIALILFVCALGFAYSMPNVLSEQTRTEMKEALPGWIPTQTVNLGLDLQGGAHLLVEANIVGVVDDRLDGVRDALRSELRDQKIRTVGRVKTASDALSFRLEDPEQASQAVKLLRRLDDGLDVRTTGNDVSAGYTSEALKKIKDQAIDQSIEVIRRRIDETGTKEPIIQRQGEDRILVQLPGVDNPQRVKDLIGKTAKLSFHLVDENGRTGTNSMTLPMAESEGGFPLAVKRNADITGDMLTNAQTGRDQMGGGYTVNFQLNAVGAKRFCKVSSENIGKRFAIVLDNEIISAPVFRSAICAGQAQISGNFTVQTANDLSLLLRAGALPADLKFVEERSVGPSLGADSIASGKEASLIALALVLIFMLGKFRLFGFFADIALLVNVTLIFALLSMLQATLTLPGIAGIVLTIGMAVDANVLIFERIKEELRNGRSLMAAIDAGYSRAIGTIMDANLTTMIAAAILYAFGTGPIKGFAVTLGIGVLTSLFTAVMVTRILVIFWLKWKRPTTLKI